MKHEITDKIEWIKTGIQVLLTETLLKNITIETEKDPELRAVDMRIMSGFYRHFTGIHPSLGDYEDVPVSFWQHIKMKLPFLKGKTRRIHTVYLCYNLCPHLMRRGDEIHIEYLQGPQQQR